MHVLYVKTPDAAELFVSVTSVFVLTDALCMVSVCSSGRVCKLLL